MNKISPQVAQELKQILNFLPKEYIEKIPNAEIEYIEKSRDIHYNTNIKSIEDINSDNVLEETKSYLAYIFLNYLANKEEKKEYEEILKINEERHQKELTEKYDITKILEKKNKVKREEVALTVIKEKSIFEIIIEKIKKLLRK